VSEGRRLSYRDTAHLLQRLDGLQNRLVLVGGQAVSFWAEHYRDRLPSSVAFHQLASRDVDFCGSRDAVLECAKRLGAVPHLPDIDKMDAVNAGRLSVLQDGGQWDIDFLINPFGLDHDDVFATSVPIQVLDDNGNDTGVMFRVLHPLRSMESRLRNVLGLPGYNNPHALAQLQASVFSAREFIRDLLGENQRAALKAAERVFRFVSHDMDGRRALVETGTDLMDAIPVDDMPERFRVQRYPQMIKALGTRRRGK
jgi:hypothetical protein